MKTRLKSDFAGCLRMAIDAQCLRGSVSGKRPSHQLFDLIVATGLGAIEKDDSGGTAVARPPRKEVSRKEPGRVEQLLATKGGEAKTTGK